MIHSAIVTGLTGQDGSYLTELLLEKGYKVYGFKRRTSNNDLGCSAHLESEQDLEIIEGDLLDQASLNRLCKLAAANEFYNLASQSHVGSSFEQPIYTAQASGLAVLNCLEAIRNSGYHTRFYQASTSELYGGQRGEVTCNEQTPFHPRSPYGCAKLFGYSITVNYRESYKLFACNGILFNHECIDKYTNLLVKINSTSQIRILRPKDLLPFSEVETTTHYDKQADTNQYSIWDGEKWVSLRAITVRPADHTNPDFCGQMTNTRNGIVQTTRHHKLIDSNGEKHRADHFSIGSKLLHGKFPVNTEWETRVSREEAELLGLIAGDGWVSSKKNAIDITNIDKQVISRIRYLWESITGNTIGVGKQYRSGYNGISQKIRLHRVVSWNLSNGLRDQLYNSDGYKKVPDYILNSSPEIQEAFLIGYNTADGLKANPCTYRYKNFKTNSSQLAQGLLYLISNVTGQSFNITSETDNNYYSINLLSPVDNKVKEEAIRSLLKVSYSSRAIARETGASRKFVSKITNGGHAEEHHLKKDPNEVKKIEETELDYVYDLCTDSGRFMAGVGTLIIGNSPRRGPNFVTRKISLGAAKIKAGKQDKLYLGNLKSKRDWGHAKDYVRGMWMMLNHNVPGDFVLATGRTHSVEDFCKIAFKEAGLGGYRNYVEIDPQFYRPAEVDILLGDYNLAKDRFGWYPQISFESLVTEMVNNDIELARKI
jgi:GDPmannose 4,6-dehydratase